MCTCICICMCVYVFVNVFLDSQPQPDLLHLPKVQCINIEEILTSLGGVWVDNRWLLL